jgi:hypothetical protein
MATWFNLPLITGEIEDRWYPAGNGLLPLFSATLYTAQGRRLTFLRRAVSLARALAPIGELGMFCAPEPRLVLHIRDPLAGDTFMPLAGPLETEEKWADAAIERLKASGHWRRLGTVMSTKSGRHDIVRSD